MGSDALFVQLHPPASFLGKRSKQLWCSWVQNICLACAGSWLWFLGLTARIKTSCHGSYHCWGRNFISPRPALSAYRDHCHRQTKWRGGKTLKHGYFTGAEFAVLKMTLPLEWCSEWLGFFFFLFLKDTLYQDTLSCVFGNSINVYCVFALCKELWERSEGISLFLPPRIKNFIRRVDSPVMGVWSMLL